MSKIIKGPKLIRPDGSDVSALDEDKIAIIDLLKETLAQALEGKISTIAIVVCLEDGFASVMAGKQAGALNLACDELKAKILAAVTGR